MKERFKPQQLKWLILILAFTSLSANAKTYLCIADKATGFVKEGNEWNTTHFRVDGKYTLKREDAKSWRWTQIGEEFGDSCPVRRDSKGKEKAVLSCDSFFYHLFFNQNTLRFMLARPAGYIYPKLDPDTPVMEIGKCSPL
jgi:hypothetical protein